MYIIYIKSSPANAILIVEFVPRAIHVYSEKLKLLFSGKYRKREIIIDCQFIAHLFCKMFLFESIGRREVASVKYIEDVLIVLLFDCNDLCIEVLSLH